ncbi:hypothetical protein, partial [Methyloceanibacter marginalis]|uniref:hypothetical protein n=1 Tax=Methyloceanibacter marginalis TaxID=1774971 RepID=UPI0013012A62
LPEGEAPGAGRRSGRGVPARRLRDLSLDKLIVRNGTVILPPSEDGTPGERITALDAEASLPKANGVLTFDASATYDGDRVAATGTIGSFAHFVEGGPVPARFVLSAPGVLPHQVTVSAAASSKAGVVKLAQLKAQYGPHALTGNATYADDTLAITQGTFDQTPFSGTAKLVDDKLSLDVEAAPEGKPLRVAGSLGSLDRFLAGGETPLQLGITRRIISRPRPLSRPAPHIKTALSPSRDSTPSPARIPRRARPPTQTMWFR